MDGARATVPWEVDQIGPQEPDSIEIPLNDVFQRVTIENQGLSEIHVLFGGPDARATTSDFGIPYGERVTFEFATPGECALVSIYFSGDESTNEEETPLNHYSLWVDAGNPFGKVWEY